MQRHPTLEHRKGFQIRQGRSSRRGTQVRQALESSKCAEAWTGSCLAENPGRSPPPLKIPSVLPEPERAATTTPHSHSDQKVPTSDSARQPELTSSLSAAPVYPAPEEGHYRFLLSKGRQNTGKAHAHAS